MARRKGVQFEKVSPKQLSSGRTAWLPKASHNCIVHLTFALGLLSMLSIILAVALPAVTVRNIQFVSVLPMRTIFFFRFGTYRVSTYMYQFASYRKTGDKFQKLAHFIVDATDGRTIGEVTGYFCAANAYTLGLFASDACELFTSVYVANYGLLVCSTVAMTVLVLANLALLFFWHARRTIALHRGILMAFVLAGVIGFIGLILFVAAARVTQSAPTQPPALDLFQQLPVPLGGASWGYAIIVIAYVFVVLLPVILINGLPLSVCVDYEGEDDEEDDHARDPLLHYSHAQHYSNAQTDHQQYYVQQGHTYR